MVSDYRKKARGKLLEFDGNMVEHMQCQNCKQDLVVARIVTVCEHGHLNDFPVGKMGTRKSKKADLRESVTEI